MSKFLTQDNMFWKSIVILLLAAFSGIPGDADAQSAREATRGELLYSTHCILCHSAEVHWRDKKIATDWTSLQLQVRRWQGNSGLAWADEDVAAVARYLNALHYQYPIRD